MNNNKSKLVVGQVIKMSGTLKRVVSINPQDSRLTVQFEWASNGRTPTRQSDRWASLALMEDIGYTV
jgi:hypothetical protein